MALLLALDGGNSKTDAVLFTSSGELVARLRGPGCGGGPADLAEALSTLLSTASIEVSAIGACVAAVAGFDFPEDRAAFEGAVRGVLTSAKVHVMNDAGAVLAATGVEHSVAVVCGAGLNVAARGPVGTATVPALGWISGDWGGGDALGREAVVIGYRSADGRGAKSTLEAAVLAAVGSPDYPSLAWAIRYGEVDPAAVGEFARLVTAAATAGDGPALAAVRRAADEVLGLVHEVGGRAWAGPIPVGTEVLLAGGMFSDAGFSGMVSDGLGKASLVASHLSHPPVVGVVRETCRLVGLARGVEERIIERMKEESP